MGSAARTLATLGITGGTRVLFCSMLSEAGQFWPLTVGAMLSGAQLSCADANEGDALRVAMFTRLVEYRAVLGVTGAILDGLDALGHPYAEVFGGVEIVGARPDAYQRLVEAGLHPHHFVLLRARDRGRRRTGRTGALRRRRVAARDRRRRPRPRHQPAAARDGVRSRARTAVHGVVDGGGSHRERRQGGIAMTRALISADNHVFEPVTLWQERLPLGFRERGPRVEQRDGWIVMAIEGMPDRKLTKANGAAAERRDQGVARAQSHELGVRAGGADPDGRLRDMALDGVVAEVIYPTFGLFIDMIPAADLQMACAAVYNDWLAETFLHRPDVFIPSAIVPVRDVDSAAAELARVAALGFKAATIPTTAPQGSPYNQPVFDPLWQIAADAGIPLSLHTGTGALPQHERGPGGAVINYAKVGLLSAETLCYFAASGVLERFPDLRLVFVETGAGWLAYCCERMDEAFEEHEQWVKPKLERPPSAYVREQCFVTLGADRAPLLTREITGVGPLLWASDYPHPEGTFPESQQVVERIFAGVPDDVMQAIVHDNAARLYQVG